MSANYKTIKPEYQDARSGEGRKYLIMYTDVWMDAVNDLGGTSAFVLWLYFRNIKRDVEWRFSPQDVQNKLGLSKPTIQRAFKTLVEKGYIVDHGHMVYSFFEEPQKKVDIAEKLFTIDERRYVEKPDGTRTRAFTRAEFDEVYRNESEENKDRLWNSMKVEEEN